MYFEITSNAKSGYWWRLRDDGPTGSIMAVANRSHESEDECVAEIQRVVATLGAGLVVVKAPGGN